MSSSNYRRNKAAIEQFQKELKSMLDDVCEIDVRILDKEVNAGVKYAKNRSPVITGFYRKNWRSAPAVKSNSREVKKVLVNSAEYASYVNYGHRTVDKDGNTTGFVRSKLGDHLLEKTVSYVDKLLSEEFKKEIGRIQKKYDE